MTDHEAFKQAWLDYPSQDNEGYVPDRGGFKAGWFSALNYRDTSVSIEMDFLKGLIRLAHYALTKGDDYTKTLAIRDLKQEIDRK